MPRHSRWDESLQVENNDICWESRNPLRSTHRNTHKTAHVHSEVDKYTNSPAWRYAYWFQTVQPVILDQAHSMCVRLHWNCCCCGNWLEVSRVTCAAWCAAMAEAILAQKCSAACAVQVLRVMCCGYQRNKSDLHEYIILNVVLQLTCTHCRVIWESSSRCPVILIWWGLCIHYITESPTGASK